LKERLSTTLGQHFATVVHRLFAAPDRSNSAGHVSAVLNSAHLNLWALLCTTTSQQLLRVLSAEHEKDERLQQLASKKTQICAQVGALFSVLLKQSLPLVDSASAQMQLMGVLILRQIDLVWK